MRTAGPTVRSSLLAGARDMSPVMLGMAPFGLLAGLAALEAGLPGWAASVFSVGIFAGAAQLAALELIADGAAAPVVIGTILVINARMAMYSASLATVMADQPVRRRAAVAYFLTDQAYAVTIAKRTDEPDHPHLTAYYFGGAVSLWACWQAYTVTGVVVGATLPTELPIEFAIPLVFAALLVPAVTDRATLVAALVSGVVAILAAGLPANLGLLVAAFAGIFAGVAVSRRRSGQESAR